MRERKTLLFLLGLWCGASVFMWFVATQNFGVARMLQERPAKEFAATTSPLSPSELRLTVRHQASETNRLFFHGWGLVQIPLASLALWLVWKSGAGKFPAGAAGGMLLIVVVLAFYVVPETIRLGRLMDFVPREPPPPESAAFWRLHGAYTSLDMVKVLLAAALAFTLIRSDRDR